ncbi:hypothetical protein KR100_08800 [Synechococcus sp. KORDI-100]|nr:hypothetical protein KR100_08800 [Synechococcus sp. KORDI-100]
MNSQFVMSSFKLKGKKFKSFPKGFLAIQPEENMIYAGFDYNLDGVINAINESFTQFQVQLNPFDAISVTEKLADKYSNSKAKGKLIFKPFNFKTVDRENTFEAFLDKNTLNPRYQMSEGFSLTNYLHIKS